MGLDFQPQDVSDNILAWLGGKKFAKRKPPLFVALGKKLESSGSIDSTIQYYTYLKRNAQNFYSFTPEALADFGANLAVDGVTNRLL